MGECGNDENNGTDERGYAVSAEDLYWHEMFRRLDENPVSIHVFGKRNAAILRTAYHEIIGLQIH